MMPVGYNSNVEIVQGYGYIAVVQEMIHDTRVIPTDGRPFSESKIPQWMGESRGYWDGDTLVVETKNFTTLTAIQQAPTSDALKVAACAPGMIRRGQLSRGSLSKITELY